LNYKLLNTKCKSNTSITEVWTIQSRFECTMARSIGRFYHCGYPL